MEYEVVKKLGRYYYQDQEGRLYGSKEGKGFVEAEPFSEGLALVQKEDGKFYYIDKTGKEIAGPYRQAFGFSDGLALVQKEGEELYYVDKTFKKILGPYEGASRFFEDGLVCIEQKNELRYYIDKTGKQIAGPYKHAFGFSDGLALVQKEDDKFYYIDKTFKERLGPFKAASEFSDGLALVRKKADKCYCIDQTGKEIAGPFKGIIEPLSDGLTLVRDKYGRKYHIDKTFKCVDAEKALEYVAENPKFVTEISDEFYADKNFVARLKEAVKEGLKRVLELFIQNCACTPEEQKQVKDLVKAIGDHVKNKEEEVALQKEEIEENLARGRQALAPLEKGKKEIMMEIGKMFEEEENE